MLALERYVAHELTFLAPNGALNVHGPYSEIRRRIALCDASGALYCYRGVALWLPRSADPLGLASPLISIDALVFSAIISALGANPAQCSI